MYVKISSLTGNSVGHNWVSESKECRWTSSYVVVELMLSLIAVQLLLLSTDCLLEVLVQEAELHHLMRRTKFQRVYYWNQLTANRFTCEGVMNTYSRVPSIQVPFFHDQKRFGTQSRSSLEIRNHLLNSFYWIYCFLYLRSLQTSILTSNYVNVVFVGTRLGNCQTVYRLPTL